MLRPAIVLNKSRMYKNCHRCALFWGLSGQNKRERRIGAPGFQESIMSNALKLSFSHKVALAILFILVLWVVTGPAHTEDVTDRPLS